MGLKQTEGREPWVGMQSATVGIHNKRNTSRPTGTMDDQADSSERSKRHRQQSN
jgi:hypothetical protein